MNMKGMCLFSWCFNWGCWNRHWFLFLWFSDFNNIWVWGLWSDLSSWIMWQHDFDLETVSELHSLGSLTSKLTRDDNFATFSAGFHDESEDTIGSTSDSQTTHKLVSQ